MFNMDFSGDSMSRKDPLSSFGFIFYWLCIFSTTLSFTLLLLDLTPDSLDEAPDSLELDSNLESKRFSAALLL